MFALNKLLSVTSVCDISAKAYVPEGRNTTAGVIQDVDRDITKDYISSHVSPMTSIAHFCRFSTSSCMKLVFRDESVLDCSKVGLVCYTVQPYVPSPLQCQKCLRLCHIIGPCSYAPLGNGCGSDHGTDVCQAKSSNCANCLGDHDSISKECLHLQRK